jgi:hypothetical protein
LVTPVCSAQPEVFFTLDLCVVGKIDDGSRAGIFLPDRDQIPVARLYRARDLGLLTSLKLLCARIKQAG